MNAIRTNTRSKILKVARRLLRKSGPSAITFDAVARELGLSKQAVIYWFPNKEQLIAELFLPYLEAEAAVAVDALSGVTDVRLAIGLFVENLAKFHLSDLERFRLMYLVPQTGSKQARKVEQSRINERIHPITSRLYIALSTILESVLSPERARERAVVIHTSVLGLLLLRALSDSIDDPLKHSDQALLASLIEALCANSE